MIINSLPIQILIQKKLGSIHFIDLCPCSFNDDPHRGEILEGSVGDNSALRASCCNVGCMRRRATQIADFAGKCGTVMMVKSRVGEKKTYIAALCLRSDPNFLLSSIRRLFRSSMEDIMGHRHMEHTENGPEILQ